MEKEIQKPANLYVIVPHVTEKRKGKPARKRVQLISTKDKFPSMRPFLPSEEVLKTHFEAERVRMMLFKHQHPQPDHVYIPQPLYIEIEPNTFDKIIAEVRSVESSFGSISNAIALTLGQGVPCCILSRHDDSEEMKEVPADIELNKD